MFFRVQIFRTVMCASLFSIALLCFVSNASARFQEITGEGLFTRHDPNGEEVQCWTDASGNHRYVEVKLKRKSIRVQVLRIRKRVRKLKERISISASRRRKQKISKKLKALRDEFKSKKELCSGGPLSDLIPTPTPSPTPAPIPEWISMEPLERAVTKEDIRYLAEKAGLGFGPREDEVLAIAQSQGLAAAVDRFMSVQEEDEGMYEYAEGLLDTNSQLVQNFVVIDGIEMGWQHILFHTNNAYRERFALFLFSVWTTSQQGLTASGQQIILWNYINKLRHAALTDQSIESLGKNLTIDPLMLNYLNGNGNSAENPNENFARELLELFTMGPLDLDGNPNYTEVGGDISKLALALTGWNVVANPIGNNQYEWFGAPNAESRYDKDLTIFQGTAHECTIRADESFGMASAAVACAFAHPSTPYYYAQEILKYYVVESPPHELIESFAAVIQANGWNLQKSMKVLLNSKAFYHEAWRGGVVKSSIHLIAELIRTFSIGYNYYSVQSQLAAQQPLADAPSVFWWPSSYKSSSPVLLSKINTMASIIRLMHEYTPGFDGTFDRLLPAGQNLTSKEIVTRLSSRMGIALTEDEINIADEFLNYRTAAPGSDELVPATYNHEDSSHRTQQLRRLLYLLCMHPAFHTA